MHNYILENYIYIHVYLEIAGPEDRAGRSVQS